jgi:predicted nucleic acid-binding protein
MIVCFDTNVLLDALLDRSHAEEALFLLDRARGGDLDGAVTPTVLTNTFYVGRRTADATTAQAFIKSALTFLGMASVSHAGAVRAVKRYDDFEDGVLGEAAAEYGADVICTRNTQDFMPARPDVLTPAELARLLGWSE